MNPTSNNMTPESGPWWRERQLLLVIVIGLLTLCLRLNALPLFGEEPRRALIAREMVESNDWLVPGTQRVFLPSRPPLQNWMIAAGGSLFGTIDIAAARWPSILSTLAVAILLYGYLRLQNSRLGSSAGAISFLTMLLVMEFGRSAETEAVFTLFVAASMLLWHWGWIQKWPASRMWITGYSFAALGMLTKGLQAPVYFGGSTVLFLLLTGNWRAIFTRGHLAGILSFVLIFGAWQIPFTWQRGIQDSWMIYFGDVAGRFVDKKWSKFLVHLVTYPAELLFVRLMPWSILLLAFGNRSVRQKLADRSQTILFLIICILFSFVFVWLPPGSKVRYYMPLFPHFAALIGIALEGLAAEQKEGRPILLWTRFALTSSMVMIGTAVTVLVASLFLPSTLISLPFVWAICFVFAAIACAYVTRSSTLANDEIGMMRAIVSISSFLILVQVGLVITVQQRRCQDIEGQILELKRQLPAEPKLVSLGLVHHAFAFFYRQPIPIVEIPKDGFAADFDYFCLHTYEVEHPQLPFAWEQIAVVNCDRFRNQSVVKDRVFVGRRTTTQRQDDAAPPRSSPASE